MSHSPKAPHPTAKKRKRGSTRPPKATAPPPGSDDAARLQAGEHSTPHSFLGAHPVRVGHGQAVVVRAYHPDATGCELLFGDQHQSMARQGPIFATVVENVALPLQYRLCWHFDDRLWECDDPYRFLPTVGQLDEHLFAEGSHRRLWEVLGSHLREVDGTAGVAFAVWAPNATRVSVVGPFCNWDGRRYPMRAMGGSGIFELFVPEMQGGALYKYELRDRAGNVFLKTDPFAQAMEIPPDTASKVVQSQYHWGDEAYLTARRSRDHRRSPLNIYELHLGSWARVPEEQARPLSYREIAPRVAAHVKQLGFNAVELMPVSEHPFTGSWGYQVSGYFAPTARYGSPDDFRHFVDVCHAHGLAVLVDWVPAHFPKDTFALARFDGTALYEHDDPRRGEHPDWGTLIFNYGRNEVRNFLVANALYWFDQFHIDGLRVDAVASMLYLDYSRQHGQWLPNAQGGRENFEAVHFLQNLNETIRQEHPDVMMIAEESTAWPGVTQDTRAGGLGFTFKWNMGWMHDTLQYFSQDPVHRKYHQDQLSFAMVYEYSEAFIMPLSHDEVVHGKGALLHKMPGDAWQKFANLRLLYAYQYLRPGKKLLFMGAEFAPDREWNHDNSLDWHQDSDPARQGLRSFVRALGALYQGTPALWQADHDPLGFFWIDHSDHDQSVLAFARQTRGLTPAQHVVNVFNFTPVPRPHYRIGVPAAGAYDIRLSSDDALFGGSATGNPARLHSEPYPWHGQAQSVVVTLPPLGVLVLAPAPSR